jgi:hypothetical protein
MEAVGRALIPKNAFGCPIRGFGVALLLFRVRVIQNKVRDLLSPCSPLIIRHSSLSLQSMIGHVAEGLPLTQDARCVE